MFRILFGMILAVLLAPLVAVAWLHFGKVPVAVADSPLPHEGQLTAMALHARIDRELVQRPPLEVNEQTLVAGAHIYSDKCAVCHGFHGKPAPIGDNMFPSAPRLFEKHSNSAVVGVSDDPAGETFWKVANGIRLTGMPDFKTQLSSNEMWEVSLLLANADKPLPPAALTVLRGEAPLAPAAPIAVPSFRRQNPPAHPVPADQ